MPETNLMKRDRALEAVWRGQATLAGVARILKVSLPEAREMLRAWADANDRPYWTGSNSLPPHTMRAMAQNPKLMIERGYCPACGHRLAAHDLNRGCLVAGEHCWCPLTLARGKDG